MSQQQQEAEEMIRVISGAIENCADDYARAIAALHEAYVDQGFTEEQALELVKSEPISISSR